MARVGDDRILDFHEQISIMDEPNAVKDAVLDQMKEFNFDHIMINLIPANPRDFAKRILVSDIPAEFIETYRANNYLNFDSVVAALRYEKSILRWTDVEKRQKYWVDGSRQVIDLRHDFDLKDGYSIPMRDWNGMVSGVTLSGSSGEFTPYSKRLFLSVGTFAYQRLAVLRSLAAKDTPDLTSREKDVLSFSAKGLSDAGIAEKLGLSIHTVDSYMRTAKRKLDAHSRTEAVVKAIQRNAISL